MAEKMRFFDPDKMKFLILSPKELTPNPNNPRINDSAADTLSRSIEHIDFRDPIEIDENKMILAGETRQKAAIRLNMPQVPCIMHLGMSSEQKEEYIISSNAMGEKSRWDFTKLAERDAALLSRAGLNAQQLRQVREALEKKAAHKAELEFSNELLLEHNYVVLYFDNPFDWQAAIDILGLKDVKSGIKTEASQKVGIGRVIAGKDIIKRLKQ